MLSLCLVPESIKEEKNARKNAFLTVGCLRKISLRESKIV